MERQDHRRVLFYSYDDSDQSLQEELARALNTLVRREDLFEWSDQQILPGDYADTERRQAFEHAAFILLLLSHAYLASDRCQEEMKEALKRRQQDQVRLIPIILSPCDWRSTPLAGLHPLPKEGSVTTSKNREQTWFEITLEIRRVVGTNSSRMRQQVQVAQPHGFVAASPSRPVSQKLQAPRSSVSVFPSMNWPVILAGLVLCILLIIGLVYGVGGNWPWLVSRPPTKIAPRFATQTPMSTANASPSNNNKIPYPSYFPGSGTYLIHDPMTSPIGSGWERDFNSDKSGLCGYDNGKFRITIKGSLYRTCSWTTNTHIEYPNFAYTVYVTIADNNTCAGQLFRVRDTNPSFSYFSVICPGQGKWMLDKVGGTPVTIASKNWATVVGDQYRLDVVGIGNTYTFFINQQEVTPIKDSESMDGYTGAVIINTDPGNQSKATFANSTLWKVS